MLPLLVIPVALSTFGASPAWTQHTASPEPTPPARHGTVIAVNMLLGGVTAGLRQWQADGSFLDGFWRGAAGGLGTYAGKVIVTQDFPGAGFAGRSVAAVGASITRNASEGQPTFHRLIIPVGPVRLHWQPGAGTIHPSLDVIGVATLVTNAMNSRDAVLDIDGSLSSGAPVLRARNWTPDWGWHARHEAGAILMGGANADYDGYDTFMRRVLHHERIHVLQYDQAYILWGDPAERAVLEALGAPGLLVRHLDFSMHVPLFLGLKQVLRYDDRPWEREAEHLSGTWRDRPPGSR
jgi:hypothetical protein